MYVDLTLPENAAVLAKVENADWSSLTKTDKRFHILLPSGKKLVITGGKDKRPRENGVAYFTPGEILMMYHEGHGTDELEAAVTVKQTFGGRLIKDPEPVTK